MRYITIDLGNKSVTTYAAWNSAKYYLLLPLTVIWDDIFMEFICAKKDSITFLSSAEKKIHKTVIREIKDIKELVKKWIHMKIVLDEWNKEI